MLKVTISKSNLYPFIKPMESILNNNATSLLILNNYTSSNTIILLRSNTIYFVHYYKVL